MAAKAAIHSSHLALTPPSAPPPYPVNSRMDSATWRAIWSVSSG